MAQHTPGPWIVNGTLIVKDCYSEVIAETDISMNYSPKRYVEHSVRKANARLMATAPELLAALKRWETFMLANYTTEDISWWDETRAAIAKAEQEKIK